MCTYDVMWACLGRGGRADYHRSSSYSEDYGSERSSGYYGNRGGSATTPMGTPGDGWPPEGGSGRGGGYAPTSGRGGGSRANRDDNWRNPTPQEEKPPAGPSWSNHWQQTPQSPGNEMASNEMAR